MTQRTATRPGPTSLLTIAETAARLGCSDAHVYRLIECGQLPAVDIAQPDARKSKTRVRSDHVDTYIEKKTRKRPVRRPRLTAAERLPADGPAVAAG